MNYTLITSEYHTVEWHSHNKHSHTNGKKKPLHNSTFENKVKQNTLATHPTCPQSRDQKPIRTITQQKSKARNKKPEQKIEIAYPRATGLQSKTKSSLESAIRNFMIMTLRIIKKTLY